MELDKIALGNRIKSIRLEKSMNLKEFGYYIDNTSDSIVSRWEKGKSTPNAKRLKLIANAGGISVNELLYGDFRSYCYGIFDTANADKGYHYNRFEFLTDPDKKRAFYDKVFRYVQEYRYDYEDYDGIYNLYQKSIANEVDGIDFTNEGSFNYILSELEAMKWKLRDYFYKPIIVNDNSDARPGDEVQFGFGGGIREGADLDLYNEQQKLLDHTKIEFINMEMEYKENNQ